MQTQSSHNNALFRQFTHIRGNPNRRPDASIVIPVNVEEDFENVQELLSDIARYKGSFFLEVILVINNYSPETPPPKIKMYSNSAIKVVSIPSLRRSGELVSISARARGLRAASSENALLFDADCRIPNPTLLINWYIKHLKDGTKLAYTFVGHHNVSKGISIRLRILIHHGVRWIKRFLLRIPTSRGSNYALNRSLYLQLYDDGILADELNVGPAVKLAGGNIVYSGKKSMMVLTSGRYITGGWRDLVQYFLCRLRINMREVPVRSKSISRVREK